MKQLLRQWKSTAQEALDRATIFANFLFALHITGPGLITTTKLYGRSMRPTLNGTGDLLLAELVSHRLGKLSRGDVVITLPLPGGPSRGMMKRVMGMEGDRVTYALDPNKSVPSRTVLIPKGHVWVQGDNIHESVDSRKFGPVPYGYIEGRVFYRVWPLDGFGPVARHQQ